MKHDMCTMVESTDDWNNCMLSIITVVLDTQKQYFPQETSPGTANVKQFVSLTQHVGVSGLCTWTEPPTCVAIPVEDLQWRLHGRHSFVLRDPGTRRRQRSGESGVV